MPRININNYLFLKKNYENQKIENQIYAEQSQYLKTHSIKDTLSTPLEQMRYENEKTIKERDF